MVNSSKLRDWRVGSALNTTESPYKSGHVGIEDNTAITNISELVGFKEVENWDFTSSDVTTTEVLDIINGLNITFSSMSVNHSYSAASPAGVVPADILQPEGLGSHASLNLTYLPVVLFIIAGIVGNVLVCLAICLEKTLQSVTNYFLLSLAVADLIVCCIVMPFGLVAGLLVYQRLLNAEQYSCLRVDDCVPPDEWPLNAAWCNFYVTCDVLACTASIWHMSVISLSRYRGIRDPLKNQPRNDAKQAGRRVMVVWALSLLISGIVTTMGIVDLDNIMPNPKVCAINNRMFFVVGSLLAFFIPMIIMVITYTLTTVLLRQKCRSGAALHSRHVGRSLALRPRSSSQLRSLNSCGHNGHAYRVTTCDVGVQTPKSIAREKKRLRLMRLRLPLSASLSGSTGGSVDVDGATRRVRPPASTALTAEKKASKVLGLVFLAFVVCWAPFFTLNILNGVWRGVSVGPYVEAVFLWLGYVSSTINPIIYTSVNNTFRRTFLRLLGCGCRQLQHGRRYRTCSTHDSGSASTPLSRPMSAHFRSPSLPQTHSPDSLQLASGLPFKSQAVM